MIHKVPPLVRQSYCRFSISFSLQVQREIYITEKDSTKGGTFGYTLLRLLFQFVNVSQSITLCTTMLLSFPFSFLQENRGREIKVIGQYKGWYFAIHPFKIIFFNLSVIFKHQNLNNKHRGCSCEYLCSSFTTIKPFLKRKHRNQLKNLKSY